MIHLLAETDWWTASAAWVAAFVALVYTGVTVWLALETHWLRESQTQEVIVMQTDPSPFGGEEVDLVLANLGGRGIYDVTVRTSRQIDTWDADGKQVPMRCGWIEHGVPFLHKNGVFRVKWGSIAQVRSFLGDKELLLTVSYRVSRRDKFVSIDCPISIGSWSGEPFLPNFALDQAISLQEIHRHLRAISDNSLRTTEMTKAIHTLSIAAAIKAGTVDDAHLEKAQQVIRDSMLQDPVRAKQGRS
jgi:hypothetical protein